MTRIQVGDEPVTLGKVIRASVLADISLGQENPGLALQEISDKWLESMTQACATTLGLPQDEIETPLFKVL